MAAMVHVALGIHDPKGDFSCHAGAMLASLFFGGSGPVCAHVVHDETLTAANQRNLSAIAQRFQKELRFYPVSLPDEYHALSGHVTKGALFRLLLPELLDIPQVIYLDCDIVVTLDIRQLWDIDLRGRSVAAAPDPGIPTFPPVIRQRIAATGVALEGYFNSGVIVLNLAKIRQIGNLFQQAIHYLKTHPESVFHDQDALNFLFQKDCLPLDSRFNRIVSRAEPQVMRMPAIWHFAGVKPWQQYTSSLDMLYWKALSLTPWQGEVLDRLAAAMSATLARVNANLARRRWVTLFPETENVHLAKDVGMIPYVMHEHFG